MAVTAEELNVIIGANVQGLTKAIDRAERRIERFSKQSKKQMSSTAKAFDTLSGAAKRLGPAIAGALTISAIQSVTSMAKELQNLSRIAGLSVEEFQVLSATTKRFGIDQEKLSDILKDVNDRIGDFAQTGGGPLKDFMENIAPAVGLTIDELQRMSSSQALQTIISTLEATGASAADTTFYLEAIASDATALAPAFAKGGAAIDEMRKNLDEMGGVLSGDDINKLSELDQEFSQLSRQVKTGLTQALVDLAPFIKYTVDLLTGATNIVRQFRDDISFLFADVDKMSAKQLDRKITMNEDKIAAKKKDILLLEDAIAAEQETNAKTTNAAIESQKRLIDKATESLNAYIQQREESAGLLEAEAKRLKDNGVSEGRIAMLRATYSRMQEIRELNIQSKKEEILKLEAKLNKLQGEHLQTQPETLSNLQGQLVVENEKLKTLEQQTAEIKEQKKALEESKGTVTPEITASGLPDQPPLGAGRGTGRTETESQRQRREARESEIEGLLAEADSLRATQDPLFAYQQAMEKIAPLLEGNTTAHALLSEQIKKTYHEAVQSMDPMFQATEELGDSLEQHLGTAFEGFISGTMSAQDVFKTFAAAVIKDIIRIMSQMNEMNAAAGAVGGQKTSLIGSIIRGLSGIAGSTTVPAGSAALPGQLQAPSGSGIGPIKPSAIGGPALSGRRYLVGERGPEVLTMGQGASGYITPNRGLAGDQTVVNQTFNISTGVAQTVRAELVGLMPAIQQQTVAAVANQKSRGGARGSRL